MILVDSNIPMYLVGAQHPHKTDAQRLLETAIAARERLVTDSEVLLEILHCYTAIEHRDVIRPAFEVMLHVVDDVFPVELQDVERAKEIVLGNKRLLASDALHVAIMERHRITRIMSFDSDFDAVPGLSRLGM